MNRLTELARRATLVYRTEGLPALTRRAATYAAGGLFRYETYYLYENDGSRHGTGSDTDFVPRVAGLSFRLVCSNEEADVLEAEGFRFTEDVGDTRRRLNEGAVAFCLFVGHELVNIGWLCTTQQAKDSLNEPPARVDFANGEAWAGGSWTSSEYRRMGLYRYNSLKMVEYWLQKGIVKDKWAIAKRNVASLTAESSTGNVRYAEARYLRVLWWKSWKEKPLPAAEPVIGRDETKAQDATGQAK